MAREDAFTWGEQLELEPGRIMVKEKELELPYPGTVEWKNLWGWWYSETGVPYEGGTLDKQKPPVVVQKSSNRHYRKDFGYIIKYTDVHYFPFSLAS